MQVQRHEDDAGDGDDSRYGQPRKRLSALVWPGAMLAMPLVFIGLMALLFDGRATPRLIQLGPRDYVEAYILQNRQAIVGAGIGQTTITPPPGAASAVIASAGLANFRATSKGRWEADGVPVGLEIRDLSIDGRGGVTPNPHLGQPTRPRTLNGIDLWTPSATVRNVNVYDLPGVAIVCNLGFAAAPNWRGLHDRFQWRIEHISTSRSLAGVWIQSSADGVADDLELADGRDFGLRCDGAAWTFSRVHAAGFLAPPTADDPDLGCGIVNGPNANYYGLGIQPDNCRIGFRNYGTGTTVAELTGKLCSETTVHAVRKLLVRTLHIESPGSLPSFPHFNPAPRAVVIESTAPGSVIGDEHSEVSTGAATSAVMFTVRASRCEIRTSRSSWGGGKQNGDTPGTTVGNAMAEYGSPTEQLYGGVIDVWANGFATGVRLTHPIARGNTIVVHHDGNCARPFDPGPNTNLAGNSIVIHDALRGEWTTIATMAASTTDGTPQGRDR